MSSRTATFLFTDLEGSTRLLERIGDDYAEVLAEHWRVLRETATTGGGIEFGAEGDAMFFAFESASSAARAAVEAQLALARHPWPEGVGVKVRMALHTGSARIVFGQWVGLALHHTARLCAAGHGGQVLVSSATAELLAAERPLGIRVEPLGEYHLRDITGPQALGQLDADGLDHRFPPLRTPLAAVTNLPDVLTTFIGRASEISEVRRLMREVRLVTLTGTGGAGKTRLAYEAAGDAGPDFDDGVWVAELAPVATAAGVLRSVAAAVGANVDLDASPGPAGEGMAPLLAHLRPKQLLLLLDNCEHVVDHVAPLAEAVLRSCPSVRVLATSREALGVAGEQVVPIPPMGDEAVRLFADRAVLARSTFEVTDDNEAAVRRICQRLDGLPLAVELAAARVASLGIDAIEARLDDRFQLLGGPGSRTALPRQKTLRAVVDWSYDLLAAEEQALLRRLSVFVGPFPADRVAGDVTPLVTRSLVVMDDRGGTTRYRLLETIREYAAEQLLAAGDDEVAAARRSHLEAMAGLVRAAAPELLGPSQATWLDRLDEEWPDVRLALTHALELDPAAAVDLAGLLGPFFATRGHVDEGRRLIEAGLAATATATPSYARIRALAAAGTLARTMGDVVAARRHHEDQLALVRDNPDEELPAKALSSLCNVLVVAGDLAGARRYADESLEIRRRLGQPRPLALALNNVGVLADLEGDVDAAAAAFAEHLAIMRTVGDPRVVGQGLTNLAMVQITAGGVDDAAANLAEALELLASVGDERSAAVTRCVAAGIRRDRGDRTGALVDLAAAFTTLADLGDATGCALALEGVATVVAGGDPDLAARLLGAVEGLTSAGSGEGGRALELAVHAATAVVRAALGDVAFEAAKAAGRQADPAALVTEATTAGT